MLPTRPFEAVSLSKALCSPFQLDLLVSKPLGDHPGFTSQAGWSPHPASSLRSGLRTQVLCLLNHLSTHQFQCFWVVDISVLPNMWHTEELLGHVLDEFTEQRWSDSFLDGRLWKVNFVWVLGSWRSSLYKMFRESCLWLCVNHLNVQIQAIWRQLALSVAIMIYDTFSDLYIVLWHKK